MSNSKGKSFLDVQVLFWITSKDFLPVLLRRRSKGREKDQKSTGEDGERDVDVIKIENICCWKYLSADIHCSKILTFLLYNYIWMVSAQEWFLPPFCSWSKICSSVSHFFLPEWKHYTILFNKKREKLLQLDFFSLAKLRNDKTLIYETQHVTSPHWTVHISLGCIRVDCEIMESWTL